jgi:hypothetical protein
MTTETIADRLAIGAPAVGVDESARPAVASRKTVRSQPAVGKAVGKVGDLAALFWADLRSAWWTPSSLPTLARAWADRMPDRDRVPGGNAVLYRGWVVYNHTLALLVPALVLALVGVLTPLVWAARHPARLALTGLIATASVALIVK